LPCAAAAVGLLASGQVSSQHTVHQPYDIETFGAFRQLMLTGDFSPKVRLAEVMAKHPTTGVGALAEARGEITIFDGKLIVSYGQEGAVGDWGTESAALLAIGSAREWQSVLIEQDVEPSEIEAVIANAAAARGIDRDNSFPFEVRGILTSYVMHVNAAPTNGPHGMGLPMAITIERSGDPISSLVAGLYVSPDLVGVVVHGGQRTHAHWVSLDSTRTAHLDRWGLKRGAVLLLPKP